MCPTPSYALTLPLWILTWVPQTLRWQLWAEIQQIPTVMWVWSRPALPSEYMNSEKPEVWQWPLAVKIWHIIRKKDAPAYLIKKNNVPFCHCPVFMHLYILILVYLIFSDLVYIPDSGSISCFSALCSICNFWSSSSSVSKPSLCSTFHVLTALSSCLFDSCLRVRYSIPVCFSTGLSVKPVCLNLDVWCYCTYLFCQSLIQCQCFHFCFPFPVSL